MSCYTSIWLISFIRRVYFIIRRNLSKKYALIVRGDYWCLLLSLQQLDICGMVHNRFKNFIYWWWPIRQIFAIGRVEGNGPLWFLLSLFLVRVIFQTTKSNKWLQIAMIILCFVIAIVGNHYSIRPRTISNVALGIFFYGLGYLLRDAQYDKRVGIVSVCLFIGTYIWMSFFGWHLIDFSFNTTVMGIHPVWLINCVFACTAVNFVGQFIPNLPTLSWLGRNSMTFLCVHALVYEALYTYWLGASSMHSYPYLVIYWVSIIVVCTIMSYVFKNKYLCWMIGEKGQNFL